MSLFIDEIELSQIIQIENIVITAFEYNIDEFEHSLFKRLGITYPEQLDNSVTKRKAEFLAGKHRRPSNGYH